MISVPLIVFVNALLASAYSEPVTTVHIQKHEGPIYVSDIRCHDNQSSNRFASNQSPLYHHHDNQSPLYHHHDNDCKCVSKINTCVPINTVPQNTCTPGCYYGCPDYGYGYGYDGQYDGCSVSDGLIPLLKSYIGQNKCPKHGNQCGLTYTSY